MARSIASDHWKRGASHRRKGNMDDAMAQYRKALEINPRDVLALFNLGRAQYDRDEYMEAMPLLEKLVDVTPDDPIAWFQLAKVYEKLDLRHISDLHTIDSAIMAYRRVLELDPHNLEAAFALMEIYLNLRKAEAAIG